MMIRSAYTIKRLTLRSSCVRANETAFPSATALLDFFTLLPITLWVEREEGSFLFFGGLGSLMGLAAYCLSFLSSRLVMCIPI